MRYWRVSHKSELKLADLGDIDDLQPTAPPFTSRPSNTMVAAATRSLRRDSSKSADFNNSTVWSLLGLLDPHEYIITVDMKTIWRRHLAWSKHDGGELRTYMTQRFASNMTMMSLLLSAELGVLFNSSIITTTMREKMMQQDHSDLKFYIGLLITTSVFLTLACLLSTFVAWSMVSAVSSTNAHAMLRSSIGQYVTQLPSRLLVGSVYCFILWMFLWLLELLPGIWSKILITAFAALFIHIITTLSSFGKLMMLSGAMGSERIFDEEFENALLPSGLHTAMLLKANERQKRRLTVTAQYSTRRLPRPSVTISTTDAQKKGSTKGRPPSHRRVETMDSVEETYLIQKTADAFSNRTSQVDPTSEGIATAPHVSSTVSPNESVDDQNVGVSDADTTSSADNDSPLQSRRNSTGPEENDAGASSISINADDYFVDHRATPSPPRPALQRTPARRRFGNLNRSVTFAREWQGDEEARAMYGCPSAAREDEEEEEVGNVNVNNSQSSRKQMPGRETIRLPRASLLNNCNHHWDSISRLTVSFTEDEDGNRIEEEQVPSTSQNKNTTALMKAANKSIEPFSRFIRKFGSNGEQVSERGSFVRSDEDMSSPEETQLLGGSSAEQFRIYSAPTENRPQHPLSPIDSVGDLEDGLQEE